MAAFESGPGLSVGRSHADWMHAVHLGKVLLGIKGSGWVCVCVRLFRHSNRGLITKGTIGSPVGKRPPFAKRVQKHMRGVAKMLEYKQKRNNGRTPFAGGVCVCVCVGIGS